MGYFIETARKGGLALFGDLLVAYLWTFVAGLVIGSSLTAVVFMAVDTRREFR
jgi:hypothetical protein